MYQKIIRPILFRFDPENIHKMVCVILKTPLITRVLKLFFDFQSPGLERIVDGLNIRNPLGLAAGFDYQAKLAEILPTLSFGAETIGTITNYPYKGNSKPRLGRLVKSKALMINKGFKNSGVKDIVKKLQKSEFVIPVGISIGKTNSLKEMSQEKAVQDIVSAFQTVDNSRISFTNLLSRL